MLGRSRYLLCKAGTDSVQGNKWFTEDLAILRKKVRKQFSRAMKARNHTERQKYKDLPKKYKKRCAREKSRSWRLFVETTPLEAKMAVLNKIIQRKEKNQVHTLVGPNGSTEPGEQTIELLAQTHFPAATRGLPRVLYQSGGGIPTEQLHDRY